MSVYADTPRWRRHGTLWGHLISDASLEELHAVAARAGLHPRSFDLDHYDWPEPAAARLDAAGVIRVGNAELTRILLRSGLRIPARRRPALLAARTRADAAALGLDAPPTQLLWGLHGHVTELPEDPPAGAHRVGRSPATLTADPGAWRLEARDAAGRAGAEALAAQLDALARRAGRECFIGQALQLPSARLTCR